jgi:uncharacterized protein YcaQ
MRSLRVDQARRIFLAAQGFADSRPTGRIDVRHLRRVIERVGVVQIDSVNVVARAHYLPLFARLGSYPMHLLDRMAWSENRELIEYWAHMAALIPIADWPLFRHRMKGEHEWRSISAYVARNPRGIEEILDRVREHGAVRPADLDEHHETGRGPWWDWSFAKVALEWLFFKGELTIPSRVNFARTYDLPERVLPPAVREVELPEHDQRLELVRKALRHCGVGTVADLADYYRQGRGACGPLVKELVQTGEAIEVKVEGWKETAYLDAGAATPRRIEGMAFLCPFDPVLWFRPRTERLFDFRYRIEIYTPQEKRVYGYYVFAILSDGELVGRLDLKGDRQTSQLRVRAAHVEPGRKAEGIAGGVADELQIMAGWLGLDDVKIERKGNLATALSRHI